MLFGGEFWPSKQGFENKEHGGEFWPSKQGFENKEHGPIKTMPEKFKQNIETKNRNKTSQVSHWIVYNSFNNFKATTLLNNFLIHRKRNKAWDLNFCNEYIFVSCCLQDSTVTMKGYPQKSTFSRYEALMGFYIFT